jgi:hypothetical protein
VTEFGFDERAVVPRLAEITAELNRTLQQLVGIFKLGRSAIRLHAFKRLNDQILACTTTCLPVRRPA